MLHSGILWSTEPGLIVCFLPSSESLGAFNCTKSFTTLELEVSLVDSTTKMMLLRGQTTQFDMHEYVPFLPVLPYSTGFGFPIVR